MANNASPEHLDKAYAKQSPKLSPAEWRPFPYLRHAVRATSTCSLFNGNDFKIRANYEQVELAPGSFPSSRLQNYSGFEHVGRRDQPRPSVDDEIEKSSPLWLSQKNSDQR